MVLFSVILPCIISLQRCNYIVYEVAEYKVGLLMMFNNIGKYNINQK